MVNAISKELERAQIVTDWAKYTAQRLQKSILKKGIGHSGDLNYSVIWDIMGSAGDISGTRHTFNYYGKFVDMGVGRGQKIESVKGNGAIFDLASGHGRKPKKWFSKTYFAEVIELKNLLQAKYGEDAANIIKESTTSIKI